MLDALKKFEPIYDWVYKIVMVLCKLLLVADILIMTWLYWDVTSPSYRRQAGARKRF